jgi:serine/threonine protein kinase
MSHPNIVKFERVFEDDKYIYILLELCINNVQII